MKRIYNINVQEPFFSYIKDGVKTIEGRLNKGKFLEMKVGDELLLNETVKLEIISITVYKTFKEMLEDKKVENVVPDMQTIEDALAVYYKFYNKQDEIEFGVCAIGVRVIEG